MCKYQPKPVWFHECIWTEKIIRTTIEIYVMYKRLPIGTNFDTIHNIKNNLSGFYRKLFDFRTKLILSVWLYIRTIYNRYWRTPSLVKKKQLANFDCSHWWTTASQHLPNKTSSRQISAHPFYFHKGYLFEVNAVALSIELKHRFKLGIITTERHWTYLHVLHLKLKLSVFIASYKKYVI